MTKSRHRAQDSDNKYPAPSCMYMVLIVSLPGISAPEEAEIPGKDTIRLKTE